MTVGPPMTGDAGRLVSRWCGGRNRQGMDCKRPAGWGTDHPGWVAANCMGAARGRGAFGRLASRRSLRCQRSARTSTSRRSTRCCSASDGRPDARRGCGCGISAGSRRACSRARCTGGCRRLSTVSVCIPATPKGSGARSSTRRGWI